MADRDDAEQPKSGTAPSHERERGVASPSLTSTPAPAPHAGASDAREAPALPRTNSSDTSQRVGLNLGLGRPRGPSADFVSAFQANHEASKPKHGVLESKGADVDGSGRSRSVTMDCPLAFLFNCRDGTSVVSDVTLACTCA